MTPEKLIDRLARTLYLSCHENATDWDNRSPTARKYYHKDARRLLTELFSPAATLLHSDPLKLAAVVEENLAEIVWRLSDALNDLDNIEIAHPGIPSPYVRAFLRQLRTKLDGAKIR